MPTWFKRWWRNGRLLHGLLPTTDGVLKALVAIPSKQEHGRGPHHGLDASGAFEGNGTQIPFYPLRDIAASAWSSDLFRAPSFGRGGLRCNTALRLEHVIATISTRFINAQPPEMGALVEQALAELAERVRADRAYFVMADTSTRIHRWSREGIAFPPGWPDHAFELVGRAGSTTPGIIHVPSVDPSAAWRGKGRPCRPRPEGLGMCLRRRRRRRRHSGFRHAAQPDRHQIR